MKQTTEKRAKRSLRRLHNAMLKQNNELGLALNECEMESSDYELCNDKMYQAAVGVWSAVNDAIERIGKILNK